MSNESPTATDDGWAVGSAEHAGLDIDRLQDVMRRIDDGTFVNVHSLVVARHGRLVFEGYGKGLYEDGDEHRYHGDFVHCTHSVTKSFTSALVGLAIEQGLIDHVDVPLSAFFPEYADVFTAERADILLSHAMTMTAGLRWDESTYPYTDDRNDHVAFAHADDPLRFAFELPLQDRPGTTFRYNSALSIALGRVIERAVGAPADEFAREHLFAPLGIHDFSWFRTTGDLLQTGGGLYLRPRDMAKFGQLYLDGGTWNGTRIVDEDWVKASTMQQAPDFAYGYQWWLGDVQRDATDVALFAALGRGGQSIYVIPELDLVVVSTAWNDGTLLDQRGKILASVLEAIA